jgi:hypothetical protein
LPLPAQGKLVQFCPRLTPAGVELLKQGDETLIMGGFEQVEHFMNNDVLKQVTGLFYQFGVEPDMATLGVATTPSGFHALQKISADLDPDAGFPTGDERWNGLMQ